MTTLEEFTQKAIHDLRFSNSVTMTIRKCSCTKGGQKQVDIDCQHCGGCGLMLVDSSLTYSDITKEYTDALDKIMQALEPHICKKFGWESLEAADGIIQEAFNDDY